MTCNDQHLPNNCIADSIFLGGNIITVNDALPAVDALAINNGKIMAVGTVDEVFRWKGSETKIVDLQGKTLMPGFIEPHGHHEPGAALSSWVNVRSAKTREQVAKLLRKETQNKKPGEWISAYPYQPLTMQNFEQIDMAMLDDISTEHPILVFMANLHIGWVNHKALEVAGISEKTPDPGHGSYYEKDINGKLTGKIIEGDALNPVFGAMFIARGNRALTAEMIKHHLDEFPSLGFTTVYNAGGFQIPGAARMFADVIEKERKLRFVSVTLGSQYEKGLINLNEIPSGNDFFHYQGFKFWYDGAPYSGTALLSEPFLENDVVQGVLGLKKNNYGVCNYERKEIEAVLQRLHDAGQQIVFHAMGDRGQHEVLEIYQNILAKFPRFDHRHRLEHGTMLFKEDAEAAVKLGLTPSYIVQHIRNLGEPLRDYIFGVQRANKMLAVKTGIKAGLVHSFHQDTPIYMDTPFMVMHCAVTRKTVNGSVIGADEAITVDEAIKGVTINAAYQIFMEDKIGSLEVGKYADMVIASANPKKVAPDDLEKIQVLQTYVEGKLVYSKI
jgi:predicted amidohydrolase YtcJ